ncbi:hypothetical protein HDU98_012323 [Podochytrium sp. JEL0797]|nr:hypothetical protein HDU98_012317 [Podochytrium sp. JEL0797]KAJ3074036.1 hypothetical protein HDU98_012323 [Podochytrium sp. JEL0797]
MRIIPLAIDIIIISAIFSAVLRIGNLEIRTEAITNFFVRWIILQFIFLGDTVLDTLIGWARQYPTLFESTKKHDDKPNQNLTAAQALSGLASAFMGANGSQERRSREPSPNTDKRRSTPSQGRQ